MAGLGPHGWLAGVMAGWPESWLAGGHGWPGHGWSLDSWLEPGLMAVTLDSCFNPGFMLE